MTDTTIKDIAREVNISYATVSRALNNKYGVKKETREKVLKAADKLDYRPNAIARGLVKKRTQSIGLVIPDITNPFFPEVARGVEDGAQEAGYNVFLCNTNWEQTRETQYIDLLAEKRVDGIVIAPVSSRVDMLEKTLGEMIPVVYVSNAPEDTKSSFVVIDNLRGGFLATKHLIESGYRTIGFIGASEDATTLEERLEGYRLALNKYGMEADERFIHLGDFRRESGYNIIRRIIEKNSCPRALFCENDLLALGVMQGAKDKGLKVPDDVAIVGFDDIPLASYPEIQMSTIYQPKFDMGKIAVGILLEKLKGTLPNNRKVILEPQLVVRRSS